MEEFTAKLSKPGGATKTRTLNLGGKLTIQNAVPLKESLLKALKGAIEVTVDLEKVTDVDTSCLQLFCSAHRTAIDEKKKFSIVGDSSKVFTEVSADAGFPRHIGCAQDNENSCIWVGGKA